MKIIDLTHTIEETMPVFPGTQKPSLKNVNTTEKDGFAEKLITMVSHTGTHMDAPAHMIVGATLDQFPSDKFIGTVTVIEADGYEVGVDCLRKYEADMSLSDFVLLKTGWSEKWGTDTYFKDFPAITTEAAEYLCRFNLKGYGVDAISVDHIDNWDFTVHHILLKGNMVLIENLTNLDQVKTGDTLSVLPLKIKDADGSPVRGVAIRF